MRQSLCLVTLIFTFLCSSLVYASNSYECISVSGIIGKVIGDFVVKASEDSKEIKNKNISSKRDCNIQNSRNSSSSNDSMSEREYQRWRRMIENHDPGCPYYRGTSLR